LEADRATSGKGGGGDGACRAVEHHGREDGARAAADGELENVAALSGGGAIGGEEKGGISPTPSATTWVISQNTTLSAATTVISQASATVENQILFIFLTQDATGGRQITWDTNLKWAPVDIAPIASSVSLFQFVSRVDPADSGAINWFYVPLVLTGHTP